MRFLPPILPHILPSTNFDVKLMLLHAVKHPWNIWSMGHPICCMKYHICLIRKLAALMDHNQSSTFQHVPIVGDNTLPCASYWLNPHLSVRSISSLCKLYIYIYIIYTYIIPISIIYSIVNDRFWSFLLRIWSLKFQRLLTSSLRRRQMAS